MKKYQLACSINYAAMTHLKCRLKIHEMHQKVIKMNLRGHLGLTKQFVCGIINETLEKRRMSKMNEKQVKKEILKKQGALNYNPEKVKDSLFSSHEFFDPNDLIQVKYEMLRRVEKDGMSITNASSSFGYSRFSFYRILSAFKNKGISGLIPEKRGPSGGYKLSEEIMDFVEVEMKKDNTLKSPKLKKLIEERFGITIHKRSIERAIVRRKKNQ